MAKAKILEGLPQGVPQPPVGQYGFGRTDLLAEVSGWIWACLIDNSAFCPQEFYYWDGTEWVDKSLPDCTGRMVPYQTLLKLYERKKRCR